MILSDVCEFIVDCPHTTAEDEGTGYPLIRTPNIGKGRLIFEGVHRVSQETYNKRNLRATPQEGDLIFAREAPAGNVAVIKKGQEVCLGQRTVLIRPNRELVDPDYLTYYLLAPQQQYKLLGTANGATVAHVNLPIIRNLPIDLPSIEKQTSVALVLSTYDDLIENNQKQIKLLEEAAQRLYKEWFVDLRFPGYKDVEIVDGVPEGWSKCTLEQICSLRKETISTDQITSDIPYIGLEHMPRVDFCLSSWGNAENVTSSKYKYNEDDIIFGKIRPYFHKVGFALNSGVVSTDSFVMKSQNGMWGLLLMTVFDKTFVDYTYQTCKEGAKMPRADWDEMRQYVVLIPCEGVLNAFEKNIWSITRQIKTIALQNHMLKEARDRLLPKLMSGEMEV